MATVGDILVRLGLDASQFTGAVKSATASLKAFANTRVGGGVGSDLDQIKAKASGVGSTLRDAAKIALGFGGAQVAISAVSAAFSGLVNVTVGMNAALETAGLQFETLLGSADEAKAHVKSLFDFAAKTPFESGPILQASRLLLTFGGRALDTRENLTLLGDAAAATSTQINDIAFWFGRAYALMQAGKPFGEATLRLQEMGVLSAKAALEIQNLQARGADASEIYNVLSNDLARFNGAMIKQAGTWKGLASTISDALGIVGAKAFKPFFDGMKGIQKSIADLVTSNQFDKFAGVFAAGLQTAASAVRAFVGGVKTALSDFAQAHEVAFKLALGAAGAWAAAMATVSLASFVGTVLSAARALGVLTIQLGLVAAAFAAAGVGTRILIDNWEKGFAIAKQLAVSFASGVLKIFSTLMQELAEAMRLGAPGFGIGFGAALDLVAAGLEKGRERLKSKFEDIQADASKPWVGPKEAAKEFADSLTFLFDDIAGNVPTLDTLAAKLGVSEEQLKALGLGATDAGTNLGGLKDRITPVDKALDEFNQKIAQFRVEGLTAGLTEAEKAVSKAKLEFEDMGRKTDESGRRLLSLEQVAKLTAKGIDELTASMERTARAQLAQTLGKGIFDAQLAQLKGAAAEAARARRAAEEELIQAGVTDVNELKAAGEVAAQTVEQIAQAAEGARLDDKFRDVNRQIALLSPGLTDYQRELLKTKFELEDLKEAHQITAEEAVRRYGDMEQALGQLDEAQKVAANNLVDKFADAMDQVVTGFLTGTRSIKDILGGLRDIGVSIFADMFKQTIQNKVKTLDVGFRGNLLTDIPNMFKTMSSSVLGIVGNLFDGILGEKGGFDTALGGLLDGVKSLFGGGGGFDLSKLFSGTGEGSGFGNTVAAGVGGAAGGYLGNKLGGQVGGIVGSVLGGALTSNALSLYLTGELTPLTQQIISTIAPSLAKTLGIGVTNAAAAAAEQISGIGMTLADGTVIAGTSGAQAGAAAAEAGTANAASSIAQSAGTVAIVAAAALKLYDLNKYFQGDRSQGAKIAAGVTGSTDIGDLVDGVNQLKASLNLIFGPGIGDFAQFVGIGGSPSKGQLSRRALGNEVLGSLPNIAGLGESLNFDPYTRGVTSIQEAMKRIAAISQLLVTEST